MSDQQDEPSASAAMVRRESIETISASDASSVSNEAGSSKSLALQHSPHSSTATLTTARFSTLTGRDISASKYVSERSEEDAIELCNDLRKAFIQGRLDHDRERTGKRTMRALETFENAISADAGDARHPFASVAPMELTPCIAALLTFVDEDADGFAGSVREKAEHALNLLVDRATSAREIHHAMLVRMSRAGKPMSDGEDPEADHIDRSCALHEMGVLIRLQAKALPKIKTKRMASFVRALANATRNGLTRLLNEDFPPGQRIPRVTEATVLGSIAELIHTIIALEPHDADVLEILRDYLLHTLAQLASSPPLAAVLAECVEQTGLRSHFLRTDRHYFREQHPRFAERLFASDPGTRKADAEAWTTVKLAANELKLGSQGLFSMASRHDMPAPGPPRFVGLHIKEQAPANSDRLALPNPRSRKTPPLSSQGAFVLLAHLLSDREEQEGLIGGWYAIRCTLPHIMAALGSEPAPNKATDEALFWLFWCFDHGLNSNEKRTEEVDEATLYPIVEVLSSLAATSADDDARFLSFRLLTTLMLDALGDRDDLQLLLIVDLLNDAPFPFLRAAALGLLRDLVIERLTHRQSTKSLFGSPQLVVELGKQILFASPHDIATVSLDVFIDQAHLQANAERLSLLYAVLTADEHNKTTLRSGDRIRSMQDNLVEPLRAAIKRWQSDDKTDAEHRTALDVLTCQLDLAETAIQRFTK